MHIVFRTDASVQIGTGHVMRCLTLADALRAAGVHCTFVSRAHKGHLLDLIRKRGYQCVALADKQLTLPCQHDRLPNHATWLGTDWSIDAADTRQAIGAPSVDWLIVDHYAIDARWEKTMRPYCKRLMIIDDLADREHDCDLLLDQNLGRTTHDYKSRTPPAANVLTGPQYALLRPEFSALRETSMETRTHPKLQHLLISLGGVDKNNMTEHVLNALCHCDLPAEFCIVVVMGANAPWLAKVQARAKIMPCKTEVLINAENMAQLMVRSDLAITAIGGTIWELCTLGLPTISIPIADNQEENGSALSAKNATIRIDAAAIQENLIAAFAWVKVESNLLEIQTNASKICDGLGTKRVASILMGWA